MVKHKSTTLLKESILGKYLALIFLRLEENCMNYKINANDSIGSKVRTSYGDIRIVFYGDNHRGESTVPDCPRGLAY